MNILETKDLCYSYLEDRLSLNNINISIEKGKTTAILGGNGAGKSTLFLNLNGVLKPKSGEVFFNGEGIDYTKKGILNLRKSVGIVFQDPDDQVFSSSVVRDISFGLMKMGLNEAEIRKRVDNIIYRMGIDYIRDTPTHELSFGQKKKVAIAGILVMEPEVIILDEPTAGLDPKGVSEIIEILKDIQRKRETSLIISTHEMDIVPIICDRAYVLDRGEVVFGGEIKDLIKNPSVLRNHGLRLPRISHLMEILKNKDGLDVDTLASTISEGRKTIKDLVNANNYFKENDGYVYKDNKKLRRGYTTGSCSAAAAKAGALMLITQKKIDRISIMTPKGIELNLYLYDINITSEKVSCAVKKDSGDDPDVTNGIFIYASVCRNKLKKVCITGGTGVGRVTRKGLECPVGEAAINKVPRMMIESEVMAILDEGDFDFGIDVEIYVPMGEEVAKRTFNERLGIEGGISILGTSGIVEPMSEKALIDSFKTEMKMLRESGKRTIALTPGNYGEVFAKDSYDIDEKNIVKISNFIGEALDFAAYLNFENVIVIGHMGKIVKLAGGIMNTHSKYADCRMEIIALNAVLEGVDKEYAEKILRCITTDDAVDYLEKIGFRDRVINRIAYKIDFNIKGRVYNKINTGFIMFSNKYGILCESENAKELINKI